MEQMINKIDLIFYQNSSNQFEEKSAQNLVIT